jgi:Tol biopolymer transport system component
MKRRLIAIGAVGAVALATACFTDAGRSALALAGSKSLAGEELTAPADSDAVMVRRLFEGAQPEAWGHSPSPDGRYVTQTDWTTGDLAVLDLLTGSLRRVTSKKDDMWFSSYAFAQQARFSPDGRRIAYSWFTEPGRYEVRTVDIDGSDVRVLWQSDMEAPEWPDVHGWTPDGQHILATIWGYRTSGELSLISEAEGERRVIYRSASIRGGAYLAAVSPDGRFVAFDETTAPQTPENPRLKPDIFLVPLAGGEKVRLVGGPSIDSMIGWLTDSAILFYSDRGLTEGVWRQRIHNGEPTGEPELVRGDLWSMKALGLSRDALHYVTTTQRREVHVATVDLKAGRLGQPIPLREPADAAIVGPPLWSPDGHHLAYVTRSRGLGVNPATLVIRSVAGEDGRELTLPIRAARLLDWAPDGQSLVMRGNTNSTTESDTEDGLYRYHLETGLVEPFAGSIRGVRTRDLTTGYYPQRLGDEGVFTLVRHDFRTGEETEITRVTGQPSGPWAIRILALNRTEDQLAYVEFDYPNLTKHYMVVASTGGRPRKLHTRSWQEGERRAPGCGEDVMWSPDGSTLLFSDGDVIVPGEPMHPAPCRIWMVPATGGEATLLGRVPAHQGRIQLHPSGTRMAFVSGEDRGEIWMMEGLPDGK